MIAAWIGKLFGTTTKTPAKRRAFQPSVTVLEDRTVPAMFYADVTPGGTPGPGNGIFTPLGGTDVPGLTLGVDLFMTVGEAVAAAGPGDDVLIANDLAAYIEPANASITIDTNLTITGVGSTVANPRPVLTNTAARFFIFDGGAAATTVSLGSVTLTGGDTGGGIQLSTVGAAAPSITVTGSFFQDNAAAAGGAIQVDRGVLTIDTTTFDSNIATGAMGGGAIAFFGGTGHGIDNSVFSGNTASGGAGGALLISLPVGGNIEVTASTISGNSAATGGGIAIDTGNVTLDPVTISGNTAAGDGGGINVAGGSLTIETGSQIINNISTSGDGGGINYAGGAEFGIFGTTIAGNTALNSPVVAGKGNGGGINLAATFDDLIEIDGSTFGGALVADGNQAQFGGAIALAAGDIQFVNNLTTLRNNSAAQAGGGIDLAPTFDSTLALDALVAIAANRATGGTGGGVSMRATAGTLDLAGAAIGGTVAADGNSAANGGGIAVSAGTVTFTAATTLRFNTATSGGGGLAIGAAYAGTIDANALLTVADNQITAAGGFGAGIANFGSGTFQMDGGSIVRNTFAPAATSGAGGGLYSSAGAIVLDGVTIGGSMANANTSTGSGGGIHIAGGNLTFSGATSTVSFNTAATGGGLAFAGTTLMATGTQFSSNQATTGNGGGVLLSGTTQTFTNATISGNQAGGAGGGIRQTAGNTTYNSAVISGNTAASHGGGASIGGGTFNIAAGVQITGNSTTAGNGGGLSYSGGSGHQINGTAGMPVVISNNTALSALGGMGQGGGIFINLVAGNGMSMTGLRVGGPTAGTDRNQSFGSGGGIAIAGGGAITLNNSTIQNNTTSGTGGGINVGGTFNGTFTLDPVIISGNIAAGDGGGMNVTMGAVIFSAGDQIINNTSTGGNGGGLAYTGGAGHQINGAAGAGNQVTVAGNSALNTLANAGKGFGGGIYMGLGAGVTFTAITFLQVGGPTAATDQNQALNAGGGIAVASGGNITVTDTTIQNNRVTGTNATGGGINIASTYAATFATDPTVITGNTSPGDGGGVNIAGGTFILSAGDSVTNNVSTGGNGGGIAYNGGTGHQINGAMGNSVIVSGNTALNTLMTAGKGFGGGIYMGLGAGVTFTTINFLQVGGPTVATDRNSALSGGGIAVASGGNISVTDTLIQNNQATTGTGGGINIAATYGATFTTDPTIIDSNVAAGDGGGINVLGGTLVVSAGDEITRNTSTGGSGGGINYGGGNAHTITSAVIAGNAATVGNGGGINLSAGLAAGTVAITTTAIGGNIITSGAGSTGGNTAGANGGGINTFAGNLTLTGNTIGGLAGQTGNTATGTGGGIAVNGGIVAITGGTIGDFLGVAIAQGNSANAGGGIEFAAGTLTFAGAATAIQFNQATTNGGGLEITSGAALTINNGTLFNANQAGASGGGIAHLGNGALTTNATVQANTATANGGGIFITGGAALTGSLVYSGTIGGATPALGNTAGAFGGGIFLQNGTIAVTASSILNNTATANDGGGVFVSGTGAISTISTSTINLNDAGGAGGGIHVAAAFAGSLNLSTLTIGGGTVGVDGNTAGSTGGGVNIAAAAGIVNLTLSTIANNTAVTNGGGIAISAGTLGMINDTVTLNTAGGQGGGIFQTGAGSNSILIAITVARNTATTATGGIRHNAGTMSVFNIISALNTGPGAGTDITTVGAGFTDGGFNLFQTNQGFALAATDVPSPARDTPLLADLGAYGGPTLTIALLPGSPAINAGNNLAGPTDQRGQPIAPVGGTRDIGAFESQGFDVVLNPPTMQSTIVNTAFASPLSVTVTPKNAGEPVAGGVVTFTAGTVAGATATIAGNVATIDGAGVATTGTVTANGTFGTYPVTISTAGFFNPPPPPLPTFTLTNLGVADVSFLPGKTGQQPTNTISGQVINATIDGVIAVILDQFGNPLPLAGISVSVTVNTGPGTLVPAAIVSILTDAAGRAFFSPNIHAPNPAPAPLVINTTGTYTLRASVATNANPPGVANTISTPFNITAAKILFAAADIPDKVRSGAGFTVTGSAVGVDNSVDPNFNENVTLGFDTSVLPAGTFNPNPQPTVAAVAGLITFNNVTLGRGGLFQLMATSQTTMITGSDPGTTKVTAATTQITQATAAALPPQPSQGPGQAGNLRSSNQASIVDPNYDNLLVTVTGFDIEGNPTDVDGNVQLTLNVGTQDRSGVPTPVVGSFQGVTSINRPAAAGTGNSAANTNIQFTAAANHLTIDRWGDYTINSTATGPGLNSVNVSGTITVIGRQIFVVNPPALVIGTFTIRTEARDVTGDIAQNYTPPFAYADGRPALGPDGADPTVLTITDLSQRLAPGSIVGINGTTVTQQGSSVVAIATPFRGVTTYTFQSAVPILVTLSAVDQKMLFIGGQGAITITTLTPGRRRPRPVEPVLNPRVRTVLNVLGVQYFL